MMKVTLPVETSNSIIKTGRQGDLINSILEELKPEPAYFTLVNGCRGGYIVFNMDDASQLPNVIEPWFLALNTHIEIQPAMVPEEFANAEDDIDTAVRKYS